MKGLSIAMGRIVLLCALTCAVAAQQNAAAPTTSAVPNLINYSGVLKDASGRTLTSGNGVTFLLYKDEQGGAPLWLETQNVTPDKLGHYTVQLGTTSASGIPTDLFLSGEPRWLAVQIGNEAEQPRVLLVAVPYAMKAADAATIGGFPPSAFVLAAPPTASVTTAGVSAASAAVSDSSRATSEATSDVTTTGGTANTLPLFTTGTNIQSSIVTQTGSGTTGKIGINTTAPTTTFYVNGATTSNGTLSFPSIGTATTSAGKNSQPEDFTASVYSSSAAAAVTQKFQWQAEPAGNDTAAASGTMNLLYAAGTATPAETGLKINSKGVFTFAAGQTFPGTGAGTITGVTAGTDLTGGGTTGNVTLDLNTTKVPLLASANTFTANQIVKGLLTANNLTTAGTVDATKVAVSGSYTTSNAVEYPMQVTSSNSNTSSIFGTASATTGNAWGVEGLTDSSSSDAYGVGGFADADSGAPIGVYGDAAFSTKGIGVFGQNESESTTGVGFMSYAFGSGTAGVGAWGDGGTTSENIAVVGTVDDGYAAVFNNNSPGGFQTVAILAEGSTSPVLTATNTSTGDGCTIGATGDLSCTGTKNAIVPVDGGQRIVAMSAIESPQNWFEDFGSAQLVHGAAIVKLDPTFLQTVNAELDYKVFPVPNGDCKGLYVTNKTATSFEVHELGGGISSVSFDYRITALRRKYENVRFADHTQEKKMLNLLGDRTAALGHSQSHDPTKKVRPMPVKTASLAQAGAVPK
jgi:hypothetical protein